MASMKFQDLVNHKSTKQEAKYGSGIAVLAYHAGTEKGTGEIAELIHVDSQASLYKLDSPHRTSSTKIRPTQSSELNGIKKYAKTAISLHGHKRDEKTIYVTGQNEGLAKKIAEGIEKKLGRQYVVETNPDNTPKHMRGVSDYNIVNKFENKGVQIELPKGLRDSEVHKRYVAESISKVVKGENKHYQKVG